MSNTRYLAEYLTPGVPGDVSDAVPAAVDVTAPAPVLAAAVALTAVAALVDVTAPASSLGGTANVNAVPALVLVTALALNAAAPRVPVAACYARLLDLTGRPVARAPLTFTPVLPVGVATGWAGHGAVLLPRPVVAATGADGSVGGFFALLASFAPTSFRYQVRGPDGVVFTLTLPTTGATLDGAAATVPPTWTGPLTCLVSGTVTGPSGVPRAGALVTAALPRAAFLTDHSLVLPRAVATLTDAAGHFVLPLIRSGQFAGPVPTVTVACGIWRARIIVPNTATANLSDLT